jgi:3-oxoadipate enol-lactonase
MTIIERGSGPPLVLIPGLQGRWEYIRPAVDALSAYFRVLTFPLCDEPSARMSCDPSRGFDRYGDQVRAALDERGIARSAVCGISFGGLIAAHFAATDPARTAALVLVSTPRWRMGLKRRHQIYLRMPWLLGPLLLVEMPWRLGPEVRVAIPDSAARRRFTIAAIATFFRAPLSVSRMAVRGRLVTEIDLRGDCERITAPTLVVTGEPGLDYVVPVAGTSEYLRLIPGASGVVIERTGHLGSVTRPTAFASIVRDFVAHDARIRWPDAAA